MMRLLTRTCIITGASRGLGRKLAQKFWDEGASLLLVATDPHRLEEVRTSLLRRDDSTDQDCRVFACDLAHPDTPQRIVDEARKCFERLTVLVNNAAILGPIGPVWSNSWMEWQRTISINLLAPAHLCTLVIPWMRQAGYGKVINLSGGGATSPRPNFSAYSAAKTALVRFTEVVSHELKGCSIDINCIAPGILNTNMNSSILEAGSQITGEVEHSSALKGVGRGEERAEKAAELAILLASAESDGITGRLLSAAWDNFSQLPHRQDTLAGTDIYTLRRIVPKDRGMNWD